MYVREKKVRRGEKTYSYWQVVQGTRVAGKVRQTVVAHIGSLPEHYDREAATRYARFTGYLCGVKGCGQLATHELEHRGYRPTYTLKMPMRGDRECPYLVCFDHLEAYRRREVYPTTALLFPEWGPRGVRAQQRRKGQA